MYRYTPNYLILTYTSFALTLLTWMNLIFFIITWTYLQTQLCKLGDAGIPKLKYSNIASPIFEHTNLYCGAFGSSINMNLSILTVLGMNEGRGNSCRSNLAGSNLFTLLQSNKNINQTNHAWSIELINLSPLKVLMNLTILHQVHKLTERQASMISLGNTDYCDGYEIQKVYLWGNRCIKSLEKFCNNF